MGWLSWSDTWPVLACLTRQPKPRQSGPTRVLRRSLAQRNLTSAGQVGIDKASDRGFYLRAVRSWLRGVCLGDAVTMVQLLPELPPLAAVTY